MTTVRTPEQLQAWVAAASPGAVLVYHVGVLAQDRKDALGRRTGLGHLADEAMRLEAAGKVQLTQRRRDGERRYEYRATKLAVRPKIEAAPAEWFRTNQLRRPLPERI